MVNRTIMKITPPLMPDVQIRANNPILRVAAYARVSTDKEDQHTSLEAQTGYYRKFITEHPGWQFAGIYADRGVSGLQTKRREGFSLMIEDCLAGSIDLVLTKSISRFARNTVDTIKTIRQLKDKGVAVYFEKENINTMDSKGEFILTLMSSFAQEESRSISENVTWGKRKSFAAGHVSVPFSRFLGYDRGPNGELVVNEKEAAIVKKIYALFLQGFTPHSIAKQLTGEGVPAPGGGQQWYSPVVKGILQNEKYKGDALLQKEFTVDFLRKKMKKNEGEVTQYYVEKDHEPIISPQLFDYVQAVIKEREDAPQRYSGVTILTNKLKCGVCGSAYTPRAWHSTSYNNLVWQCRNRIRKGEKCTGSNIYDKLLHYMIHDIARATAFRRNAAKTATEIVIEVTGRPDDIRRWMQEFRTKSPWDMLSDEDDFSMVIKNIITTPDNALKIKWIDGGSNMCRIPKYIPWKGEVL